MVKQLDNKQELLKLAKQGHPQIVAAIINKKLKPKGITVKVSLKKNCLQLMFEAAQVPPQQPLVQWLEKFISKLDSSVIKKVKIYGRKIEHDFPEWLQEFELPITTNIEDQTPNLIGKSSLFNSLFGSVADITDKVGNTAIQASQAVTKAVNATDTVNQVATQTHQIVANTANGTGQVMLKATNNVSQTVVGITNNAGKTISSAATQTTDKVGSVMDWVNQNSLFKSFTSVLKVDWLIDIINQVDIVKAETEVQRLQAQYPDKTPRQISHKIMLEKAIYVGGTGIATSLIPGVATSLITVDLAATTAIQAEMIYQIACAYGFDLKQPARQGEIVAIFGLAMGGSQALKLGLGFIKNVPVAGAVISGSTNAVMLYALGYAACQFYEAQLDPVRMETNLETAETEIQHYLTTATDQQILMDQILVHIILADHPGKTWQQILPELKAANLSPASLAVIEQNIESPPTLQTLLEKVNDDFAVALLAQCQKIAQADGIVTPEEKNVIKIIIQTLNIEGESLNLQN